MHGFVLEHGGVCIHLPRQTLGGSIWGFPTPQGTVWEEFGHLSKGDETADYASRPVETVDFRDPSRLLETFRDAPLSRREVSWGVGGCVAF